MPNAIYPPRWQPVPPAKHPEAWRWAAVVASLALLLVVLMLLIHVP